MTYCHKQWRQITLLLHSKAHIYEQQYQNYLHYSLSLTTAIFSLSAATTASFLTEPTQYFNNSK